MLKEEIDEAETTTLLSGQARLIEAGKSLKVSKQTSRHYINQSRDDGHQMTDFSCTDQIVHGGRGIPGRSIFTI